MVSCRTFDVALCTLHPPPGTTLQGHEACVAYLLDAGADITATDEHDYTALHLAAYYGRVGVVALLLR